MKDDVVSFYSVGLKIIKVLISTNTIFINISRYVYMLSVFFFRHTIKKILEYSEIH